MSRAQPAFNPHDGPSLVRTDVDELTASLCELAGHIHAATAELVRLLGRLDAIEGWQGVGIRSLGHWASIYLGIDLRTAAQQAQVGRQLDALPAIDRAAAAGELGWSKLRLLARVAEPASQAKWLDLARELSVGQLARVVGAYRRASETDDPDRNDNHRERRGIWLFDEPDGLVRITGLLEPDDAAVLRAALAAHGELLWRHQRRGDAGDTPATEHGDASSPGSSEAQAARTHGEAGDGREAHAPCEQSEPADPGAAANPGEPAEPGAAAEPGEPTEPEQAAEPAEPGAAAEPTAEPDGASDPGDSAQPARPSEVDPTLAARDPAASRRVDALVALARAALAAGATPDDGDDLTEVLVVVDHDVLALRSEVGRCQLHNGPPIGSHTARRLCCDALIRPLLHRDGQPLDLGRAQRLVNRAQRRALRFRDGPGCAFPGCGARHVDAHHLVFWDDGGPTDLANLCLLCRHHHRLLHEGGYRAELVDGRPRFHRPDGTPIRPPDPPPPDLARGSTELRRRHRTAGRTITPRTAEARSGGAPWWSPQPTLDALFT